MKYDFSTPIKRKDTDCVSMELMKQATGRDDLMPLWIADMGFPTPPFVIKAITAAKMIIIIAADKNLTLLDVIILKRLLL